jgi:polysaccharide deacetylase 2 family uncharacterized protein YibQ
MTKRRLTEELKGAPEPEKGPGIGAVVIAIFGSLAMGLGLGAFWDDSPTYAPIRQMTLSVSSGLNTITSRAPEVLPSMRLGEWPAWLLNIEQGVRNKTQTPSVAEGGPAIAIIIDDAGMDEARTREAIALPPAVTLSFLPYADASRLLSRRAHRAGHEVIVHLPMQPVGKENPGPMALTGDLPPEEMKRRVEWALTRVSDYDGVNNHMGSKFTASRKALIPVMETLGDRGLFFLDSRTTADTQAEKTARDAGLLTGARDVFLDDEQDASSVARELLRAEQVAKARGSAIVIGHPHPETLAALKIWTDHIDARGFRLLPLKDVLTLRANASGARTAARAVKTGG